MPFRGDSREPLKYQSIEVALRELIQTLAPGAKLPSERNLSTTFDCSFLTVRRALQPLVTEGVVTRRVGSGTFVSSRPAIPFSQPKAATQLGVLVFQSQDAYAYQVLQAISQAADEVSVKLSSTWVSDFSAEGLSRAETLASEGCQVLILPWLPADQMGQIRQFADRCPVPLSLPMVVPGLEKFCFERQEVFGTHAISATEAVVRYFQQRGNRRIAFLGPDTPSDPILQKKLSAYACHTSREKLPNLCGLVAKSASAMDSLAEQWKSFRDDLAVVAYDDEHAIRLITAMHKLGLSAPGDYRVIGFNNTEASAYSDPPLSTVCQNFAYIGRSLIRSALALAAGELWQSAEVPRTRLVLRSTCGGSAGIDAAFRALLPEIDFVSTPEAPRALSGATSPSLLPLTALSA